jgi:hypothetical protein
VPPPPSNNDAPVRQAPATDPIPASPSGEGSGNGSEPKRSRPWLIWIIAGLGALALVGGVAWFVLTQGGVRPTAPGASPGPSRVPFAFAAPRVHVSSYTGRSSKEAARTVAEDIGAKLSTLYDRGYVDPSTWSNGFPPQMWEAFAPDAARRARREAKSFGLGRVEGLEGLQAIEATLTVDVLEDPGKRPQGATATVEFRATGVRTDGSTLEVRSKAVFLFRAVGRRWLIVGFPFLRLKADSIPPPAPVAGPSGGPTPSAAQTG